MSSVLPDLHPDTEKLIDDFAQALKDKLKLVQVKRGFTNQWLHDDWQQRCQQELQEHVYKGDPLDVAAYAAFCWHRQWSTNQS